MKRLNLSIWYLVMGITIMSGMSAKSYAVGSISGTVTDSSQSPIQNFNLIVIVGTDVYVAISDANGDYTIENVPAGNHKVVAVPNNSTYPAGIIEDVTVVSGQETSNQDFTIGSNGKITGTITDSQGTIKDATVVAVDPCTPSNRSFAQTAANGTYTVSYLPPSSTYMIFVSAEGYVSDSNSNVIVTEGDTNSGNDFTLGTSGGSISGTVYKSDGQTPIEGAFVNCYSTDKSFGQTATNASGEYSLTLLQAGTYKVNASAEGYVLEQLTGIVVTVPNENSGNDFTLDEEQ